MITCVLPFGDDAFVSEHIFKNLFGEAVDLTVDEDFLTSWEAALLSDATSIGQFIDVFLKSYGTEHGVPLPDSGVDTHALWTILKGVSINLDPPAIPGRLVSALRSAVQTVVAPGAQLLKLADISSLPAFREVNFSEPALPGLFSSLLTGIQRRGP